MNMNVGIQESQMLEKRGGPARRNRGVGEITEIFMTVT